jgi:hypothetical protein
MLNISRNIAIVVVIVGIAFGAEAAKARKKSQAPTPLGSIAGTVKSGDSPVRDATVTIWRDGKRLGAVNVSADGEFMYPTPEGTYEVQASAPQYRPAITIRITVVAHSGGRTWVNLLLVPAQ